jgi:hypothetical protein
MKSVFLRDGRKGGLSFGAYDVKNQNFLLIPNPPKCQADAFLGWP